MSNDVVDRLRSLFDGELAPLGRLAAKQMLNQALADERRATVERIRAAIREQSNDFYLEAENGGMQGLIGTDRLFAVLDAEAE